MGRKYIDRAFVFVDGQEIADVIKVDVTQVGKDKKPVKTMNKANRPRGFTGGQPHWELSVEVAVPTTGEYDWKAARDADIDLTVTLQEGTETAGVRNTIYPSQISEVSDTYSEAGETRRTIKFMATDEIPE